MKKFLSVILSVVMLISICSFSMLTAYAADWTVTLHDVDGNGGTATYECNNNATIPRSQDPVREGYYFAGWFKDAELTKIWWDSDKVTANLDLYAKWVNLPGAVVTDNIDRNSNITYTGGGNYAQRVRNWFVPGYTFNYIYNDQALINNDVVITVDLNNAHDLYGAVIYTLGETVTSSKGTLNPDQGGSYRFSGSKNGKDWDVLVEVTEDTRNISDSVFPADSRYRFVKLETLGNHKNSWWTYHKIAILGESNPYSFNIPFMSEGQTFYTAENVPENTAIAGPSSNPVHSQGKIFAGWYYNEECTIQWSANDPIVEETTLYARWLDESCTVTFDSCGGSDVGSMDVEKGVTITAPVAPTKADHIFCGWYKDSGYAQAFDFAVDTIEGATTLYAKWAAATNSINTTNGISEVKPMTAFDNRNGRISDWFFALNSTSDKSVVSNDIVNNPIQIRITLAQPYVISAVKTKLMDSMKNVDYTIYGTNDETLAWDAEGWETILDVKANGEAERSFGVDNNNAYQTLRLEVKSNKSAWVGFYAIEFFGEVGEVEAVETTAKISGVEGGTVSYAVTLADADKDATVIVALYNGNDLVAVKTVDAAQTSYTFANATGANKAKIFVWEDLIRIKPLATDEVSF